MKFNELHQIFHFLQPLIQETQFRNVHFYETELSKAEIIMFCFYEKKTLSQYHRENTFSNADL